MGIYLILWSVVLVLCILEMNFVFISIGRAIRFKTSNVAFWICFLFILILGIFRETFLGVDQLNYLEHFNYYGQASFASIISRWKTADIGYFILGKLIYIGGGSFYIFKCILFTIVLAVIGYGIYKNSQYKAFSFLVFLALGNLSICFCLLRMSVALAFCFQAYFMAIKRNQKGFLAWVFIAVLFHKMALGFIFIYPLLNNSFKKSLPLKILYAIGALGFGVFVVKYLPLLYSRNDYSNRMVTGEGWKLLIFYLCISIVYVCAGRLRSRYFESEDLLLSHKYDMTVWIIVCIQIMPIFFSELARIISLYAMCYVICIPYILKVKKRDNFLMLIFAGMLTVLYYVTTLNSETIVPYISIF